ncbi:MAG: hypothetical protein EPN47_19720 [Acidobacteria bacterium]|nr:MAG: hypothetical protein EPN47_19720 [Acidobacteriota bacterium]
MRRQFLFCFTITTLAGVLLAVPSTGRSQVNDFVRSSTLQLRSVAPGFSEIGPVATNLWTFNALNAYDSQLKTDVFYITSFNSAGLGQLIRLDYRHNRAKSWMIPAGIGSWGIFQGKDGNLYLGSYNEGKLLCFNPRSEEWIPLPQASEAFRKKEFIICDLAQAPNGNIYYGTYPGCHLVCYNPHTGKVIDLGKVADENYLRNIAVTPQGIVLCGVGTRFGRIITYNPSTRQFQTLTPKQYQLAGATARPMVSPHFVVELAGDNVLIFQSRTLKLLRTEKLPGAAGISLLDADHIIYQMGYGNIEKLDLRTGEKSIYYKSPGAIPSGRWFLTRKGNLMGMRVQSYIFVNIKDHTTVRHRIPIDGLGQEVLWLRSFPNGLIYGGPGLGQTLFSYNPQTHQLISYDQVMNEGGEIYYGIPYKGKLYTMSYVEATLVVFDPDRPWNQGDSANSNPRTVLHIPEQQYRPVGGIHLGPGDKMYIGTQPDYGLIGGALSVFDPATEKLEVHRDLVPNEEINAVATDEKYVYCGADPSGGGGSKAVATNSHFFVWDPGTKKIVFDQALNNARGLGAIAAVNSHAYFVTGDQMMDYDSHAGTLTPIYHFDHPRSVPLESLQAAKDGTLWGILGDELAHIFPARREVHFFPETAGKAISGLTIGADGTIYFGNRTQVWIYLPESPSPPASFGQ